MFNTKMMKRTTLLLVILLILSSGFSTFAAVDVPTRSDAPDAYQWDLTEFYSSTDDFYADMASIENELLPQIESFKGTLNTAEQILKYNELDEKISKLLFKGYVYANLMLDLNQNDQIADQMANKANQVYTSILSSTSYATPEILSLPTETLEALKSDPLLSDYRLGFEKLLAQKEHVLSEDEEAILSLASEFSSTPKNIYDKVTLADFQKAVIQDKEGNDLEITGGNFYVIMNDSDRDFRKRAYLGRLGSYEQVNQTLAAVYLSKIKSDIFFSKVRKYPSSLEASLDAEFVPKTIYDNLITSVNHNLYQLHRYYKLRKETLGYDKFYGYDTYVPLIPDYQMTVTYEDAQDLLKTALAPLGDDYIASLDKGFNNQWIDVYEDSNKYTGAYSWGTYESHPYILMNYDNTLDSALTLAHEMGHALNSYYSNKTQTYNNADYPIFTAEVTSTMNELLVTDYLIQHATNDQEKLYLINKQVENIRGTVFVQVMFAEFEQKTHELVESGEPLSADILNQLWLDMIKKYFGPDYEVLDEQQYDWARIPHFYYNFYVYKYATSMSAAFSLFNQIKSGDESSVERYLEFISSGGSDYPVDILKKAGVDMNTSEPVDSILSYFGQLLSEMEVLLHKTSSNEIASTTVYIVQPGDVLWQLAETYNTTVETLRSLNQMTDMDILAAGQELLVPAQ